MPLKLVTFDVTGTLLFFRTPVVEKYAATATRYGILADKNNLKKCFRKANLVLSETHANYGRHTGLGWQNWWTFFVAETFKNYVKPGQEVRIKEMAKDLMAYHTTRDAFVIRPGTEDLLQHLKSKNIKLGVVSNYDPRLYDILREVDLKKFFDFILISYDVGYLKPDRRIFDEALKLADCVSAEEAIHIGDDLELDYLAARNAGMNAILINSNMAALEGKNINMDNVFENFFALTKYFQENGLSLPSEV